MENRNLKVLIVVLLFIIVVGIVAFIAAYESKKIIIPKKEEGRIYVKKEDFKVEEDYYIEDEELNEILEKRDDLKLQIEEEKNIRDLIYELDMNNTRILEIIDDIKEYKGSIDDSSLTEEEHEKYMEQQMKRDEFRQLLQERQKIITKLKEIINA